jgi:chromosome segregation ATPase
MSITPESG